MLFMLYLLLMRLMEKLIINAAGIRATGARGFDRRRYQPPTPQEIPVRAGRSRNGWTREVAVPLARRLSARRGREQRDGKPVHRLDPPRRPLSRRHGARNVRQRRREGRCAIDSVGRRQERACLPDLEVIL